MKEWWQGLSQRERILVSVIGIIVILLLVYYIIWEPLSSAAKEQRSNAYNNRSLVAWMTKANQLILESGKSSAPKKITPSDERLVVVQQTLKANDIDKTVKKLEQTREGRIKLQFQGIYFDSLSHWLITLWKNDGIGVYQAAVKRDKTLGKVDAQIILGDNKQHSR